MPKVIVLTSKENAELKYELHPLYDYPLKCRTCDSRVRGTNTKGLFECDCHGIMLDYPCGV